MTLELAERLFDEMAAPSSARDGRAAATSTAGRPVSAALASAGIGVDVLGAARHLARRLRVRALRRTLRRAAGVPPARSASRQDDGRGQGVVAAVPDPELALEVAAP